MRHPGAGWIGIMIVVTASTTAAQVIERVSVSSGEVEANGNSYIPLYDSASADGRFVVFESDATNLVPADGNGLRDVFVRDRLLGTTTRMSEVPGGGDASGESRYPSISEDGRWIAFTSDAHDLVIDDTNAAQDVFVFDRNTGQISRVSMGWDGSEGNGDSRTPSINGDGRYVAFRSSATNLVSGPMDSSKFIYVCDLQTGDNELVSVTWAGVEENGGSWYPHISANGRHVAFISNSTNLVSFDENGGNDAFMRDLDLGVTTMIGVNIDGEDGNSNSGGFGISANGRYAGIFSNASDLLPPGEDFNAVQDAFVRERGDMAHGNQDERGGRNETHGTHGDHLPGVAGSDVAHTIAQGGNRENRGQGAVRAARGGRVGPSADAPVSIKAPAGKWSGSRLEISGNAELELIMEEKQ